MSSEQSFKAVDWSKLSKAVESGSDLLEAIGESEANVEYHGTEQDVGRCIAEEIAPQLDQLSSAQYWHVVTFLSACYPQYMCELEIDDADLDLKPYLFIRDLDVPDELAEFVNFVMSPATVKKIATVWKKIDLDVLQKWSSENSLDETEFFEMAGDFVEHIVSLRDFFEEASLHSCGLVSLNSF